MPVTVDSNNQTKQVTDYMTELTAFLYNSTFNSSIVWEPRMKFYSDYRINVTGLFDADFTDYPEWHGAFG